MKPGFVAILVVVLILAWIPGLLDRAGAAFTSGVLRYKSSLKRLKEVALDPQKDGLARGSARAGYWALKIASAACVLLIVVALLLCLAIIELPILPMPH